MAIRVRTRFEVFKRDEFTCQYCGRKSPEVVLEVDHIVPRAGGGTDDIINLRTSCWECNSGKSDKPLNEIVTGEDPHDRAVLLLERERQLKEYNEVLAAVRCRIDADLEELETYWESEARPLSESDRRWLLAILQDFPKEIIRIAMATAIRNEKVRNLSYVNAVLKNQRERGEV